MVCAPWGRVRRRGCDAPATRSVSDEMRAASSSMAKTMDWRWLIRVACSRIHGSGIMRSARYLKKRSYLFRF